MFQRKFCKTFKCAAIKKPKDKSYWKLLALGEKGPKASNVCFCGHSVGSFGKFYLFFKIILLLKRQKAKGTNPSRQHLVFLNFHLGCISVHVTGMAAK